MKTKTKTTWEVVRRSDAARPDCAVFYRAGKFNAVELRFQMASASHTLACPMVAREVKTTYEPLDIAPMDSLEAREYQQRREADLRSGRRKLRL